MNPRRALSRAADGARLGVSQGTVSKVERGLLHAVDAELLRRYCRAIGCDPESLDPTFAAEGS